VMVQGDTNSVLAGALAAYKSGVPVAHLEAGLRSDDWDMPEESNRVLADRISKWLFAPTEHQRERLAGEGITHSGVHVVGNTIVDASLYYSKVAYEKSDIAERLKLTGRPYALLTMHRPSNVDEEARLRAMINAIGEAAKRLGMTVVFPVHPRTRAMLDQHRITHDNIIETAPIGYLDLLRLQAACDLVLTDSGGMQEEACILRVPTVTLRANTERPETLRVGSNVLHHEADVELLHAVMQAQRAKVRDWENPFGDGRTAIKVLDIMIRDVPSLDSRPKTQ
jgi:UDP-N-acetylglucosamine 2-epimerase (non-hydrolysing)